MLSVHLEGNPRRDAFRAARHRLENAAGSHTIAGEIRALSSPSESKEQMTMAPGEVPLKANGGVPCWIIDRGIKIPLKIGMNSVGRLPDNDITIDDPTVSRRHCAIMVHSDLTCELHDVASKNGTLLNGRKMQGPARLRDGDELCLSEHRITFSVTGSNCIERLKSSVSMSNSNDDRTFIAVG
jgi:pSer/pThr/pTyr-binding forkhead associated (FHA) protein